MRSRLALALGLLAGVLAGCGGGDGGYDAGSLRDGRAIGPGFGFRLGDGWERFTPRQAAAADLRRGIEREVRGLDSQGFLFAGLWADRSQRTVRPIVNVVLEPVTADTSLSAVAEGSARTVAKNGIRVRPLTSPSALGSAPARGAAWTWQGSDTRSVTATRGSVAYTLTVQMRPGHTARLDALTRSIARTWRWPPPSAADRRRVAALGRIGGDGYRTVLPPGWRGTDHAALARAGRPDVDTVWRGWAGPGDQATRVAVRARPLPGVRLERAVRDLIRSDRATITRARGVQLQRIARGRPLRLDGTRAATVEIALRAGAVRQRTRQVLAVRGGRGYAFALSTSVDRYARDARQFATALARLRWTR